MNIPAGPLEAPPELAYDEAERMLDRALSDIDLGTWDHTVRSYVLVAQPGYIATIASWVRRGWAEGVEVGRAERKAEIDDYHARMQEARAALDRTRGAGQPE